MFKKILVILLAIVFSLSAVSLWAQRGAWEGCTLKSMKANFTDQQVGGYFLHESAALIGEASRAVVKAHTPGQRETLSRILSEAYRTLEHISDVMREKRLSQRDINAFHREISREQARIKEISR